MIKDIGIFLGSVALAFSASAEHRKLSPEFDGLDPKSRVKVIVTWKKQPDAATDAKVVRRGGQVRSRFAAFRAGEYEVLAREIRELANDADVEHISLDH